MYALSGNKRIPSSACVYHAVRKTFDLDKEKLKGYKFKRFRTMIKNLIVFQLQFYH